MFVGGRRGLQPLPLPSPPQLVLLVSLTPLVVMRLRRHLPGLHREEGGTRGAGAPGAPSPGVPAVDVSPVLSVDPLPAHGGQLAASGQEHDHEGDAGGGDQAGGTAHVLKGQNISFHSQNIFHELY